MKTIDKLQSLFKKLDKAEEAIGRYQNSLQVAPFREIKKALNSTLIIRDMLEQQIIKVADVIPKDVELRGLKEVQEGIKESAAGGVLVDFDEMYYNHVKMEGLREEINEAIK